MADEALTAAVAEVLAARHDCQVEDEDTGRLLACRTCAEQAEQVVQVVHEHTAAEQAEAWAACVAEAESLGWMHDLAADDVASRNPYRVTPPETGAIP